MKNSRDGSLKEFVYNSLYNDILNAKILPGESLTEKELVEKYNISKSPIREALIALANEGIIRSIPRFGYEVITISQADIAKAKQTRIILEMSGMNEYFNLISEREVKYLRSIINENKGTEMNLIEHWDKNSRFHIALMECYQNRFLTEFLTKLMAFMTRGYIQYQYNRHQNMHFTGEGTAHSELLDALEMKDKKLALAILSKDIGAFETSY